ncbi:MAG TPA: MBL fold metallo-hydrolase [Gemmataceae bacterium]|nr:MBL fold metallo-hydrolase [Gemmataceae bacterium]
MRFTVLASGSAGNASLLETNGFGLLLDLGLGPRQLAARLAAVGASWQSVHAAVLTHTHSDHWNDRTLAHLLRRHVPLWCHPRHEPGLLEWSPIFPRMREARLVRHFEASGDFEPAPGLRCRPLPVRHDGGPTFGFRVEEASDLFGPSRALGYAADLGSWDADLLAALLDVDLLALEFNHDVRMEQTSGRHPRLIARVLGDHGHLSNAQAAALLGEVLRRSSPGRLKHVVQLHLSRHCNRAELALEAARAALAGCEPMPQVYTARQDEPGPTLHVGRSANGTAPTPRRPRKTARGAGSRHPMLPGVEWE